MTDWQGLPFDDDEPSSFEMVARKDATSASWLRFSVAITLSWLTFSVAHFAFSRVSIASFSRLCVDISSSLRLKFRIVFCASVRVVDVGIGGDEDTYITSY